MVKAGAVVVGEKPVATPSLSDDQAEFKTIADELWANETGENSVGKGKVYGGQSVKEVLTALNRPRFRIHKAQENTNLLYVHRKLDDVDLFWVNNRQNRIEDLEATFRVEGKDAEIWHPETGKIEQVSYTIENGVTRVPLHLVPSDAVFVVFRNKTGKTSRTIAPRDEMQLASIEDRGRSVFSPVGEHLSS